MNDGSIISALKNLEEKVDALLRLQQVVQGNTPDLGDFIPEKEIQKMLGKKYGSLYRLRTEGKLSFSKFGNKTFYKRSEIISLLESNLMKEYSKNNK